MLNNLNQVEPHDYTNNIFIGKVVFNEDPLGLRRVKCEVPGLFEGPPEKLPWIAPMFMGFVANIPGNSGSANLVPGIGAELVIELQMGSPLHGLYVASMMRPGSKLSEFDSFHKYGWKDPAGNVFLVDTEDGQNTIRVFHASGSEIKIEDDGKMMVKVVGALHLEVTGTTSIVAQDAISIDAHAGVQITAHGHSVSVSGGDVTADGISLKNHVHSGVDRGGEDTDPPKT